MKKSIILLLGAIILTLFLLEGFVRYQFHDDVDTTYLQQLVDSTRISSFTRPSANKDIVYEFIPNIRVQWKGVTVASSKDGCCRISAARPTPPSPPGAFRLAVIGDSTAFGWRVEYEDTYAFLLKKQIENKIGRRVVLRNYSLPGYNSHQLLAIFKERVVPWKPNLTILHYDHNDADPVREKPPNYIPPEYGNNIFHSALIKLIARRIRYQYNKNLTTSITSTHGKSPELIFRNYRYAGPQYESHLNNLKELAKLGKNNNIPIACFIFNTFETQQDDLDHDKMYVLLHKPLVPKLKEMGYFVIDSYPISQKIFNQRHWKDWSVTWFSNKDAHPNVLGHKIISNIIFDALNGSISNQGKIQWRAS